MSLRQKLQDETAELHRRLDALAIKGEWFETRAGYGVWLRGIHAFHTEVHRVVRGSGLGHFVDDQRCRRLLLDMADLQLSPHPSNGLLGSPPLENDEALGILYVAEGSRLGSRVLYLKARELGFHELFGARFLAAEAGSLETWRSIVGLLEGNRTDSHGDNRVVAASFRAFRVAQECFNEYPPAG